MAKKLESVFTPANRDNKTLSKDETVQVVSRTPNYERIAESPEFQSLKSKKRKFILPVVNLFLIMLYYVTYFDFLHNHIKYKCIWGCSMGMGILYLTFHYDMDIVYDLCQQSKRI